ncbi:polysaccharide deacetylase family protein [Caldisericum exile]|uniref:NodB homology domain-containing protein n=1 Tax=Caldisericum exile (strain DSM 21853 / NBRC 104410 / AZM16c01) TaxID=511051 RepID=A0A7U6JGM9_CALEA|nr:hypothetical protein [Caldisericum exile]BAL80482.1 hypothetical protein CSE_03560 [Caldisericum exile AZM16c01]
MIKSGKNYIDKNTQCLENIIGYKIKEYSAPNGVHPEVVTKILESEGFNSYYYTGDNGSVPNRTFLNGSMVSSNIVAFPITSYKKYASLYEMYQGGVSSKEVEKFLNDLTNYAIKTKTVRLFYSHPYDFPLYEDALRKYFLNLINLKNEGKIQIKPMSYFAEFFQNLFSAKFEIDLNKKIILVNGRCLNGFVIALPKEFIAKPETPGIQVEVDENYTYLKILEKDKTNVKIPFELKN